MKHRVHRQSVWPLSTLPNYETSQGHKLITAFPRKASVVRHKAEAVWKEKCANSCQVQQFGNVGLCGGWSPSVSSWGWR